MKMRTVMRKGRRVIKASAIYIFVIVMFVAGYMCSDAYITKELTDQQYESCKEMIYSVYTEGNTVVDLPDDMYFDKSLMKVGFDGHFGYANMIWENQKLIIEREYENSFQIFINIICGLVSVLLAYILKLIAESILEKIGEME